MALREIQSTQRNKEQRVILTIPIHVAVKVIKQVHDSSLSLPQTFTTKQSIGNRYPPCLRYGCGKREMHVRKDAVPYSVLASKIRRLQRKREEKLVEPPCGRYGCGKRK